MFGEKESEERGWTNLHFECSEGKHCCEQSIDNVRFEITIMWREGLVNPSGPSLLRAGAKPRARNLLGTLVGYAQGLFALGFSPDALAALLFLELIVPEPLYYSVQKKLKNNAPFLALKALEPVSHLRTFPKPSL